MATVSEAGSHVYEVPVEGVVALRAPEPLVSLDEVRPWIARHQPSLRVSERKMLLAGGDALLLLLIARVLAWLRWGSGTFLLLAIPIVTAWLIIGYFADLYDLSTASRFRSSVLAITRVGAVVTSLFLLLFYVHPYVVSRSDLMAVMLGGPAAITVWRLCYIRFLGVSRLQRRVLVVGTGASCRALLQAVRSHSGHGVLVVGLIDDEAGYRHHDVDGVPVLGTGSEVWSLVTSLGVEEVVLAADEPAGGALTKSLGICYERGLPVSLMPHLYEEVAGQVPVEHMGPAWLGAVPLLQPGGRLYVAVKRCIDVIVAGTGLVLALPVMAIVALLVRLSSPGPILFRQERQGQHGNPFELIKFRTMRVEQAGTSPVDRPVTGAGKWLRRTHLDELPQLLLILRGDMSLVGPRPKRASEARQLERTIPLYRVRYSVRPGLTGWAQIRYRYARNADDEMTKLRYDLYYVKHQSLLLDLSILVRTVTHVMGMRGF